MEQILNVYNANPSLPPLSYLPQPAPAPPAPLLYPAFPAADQALLETDLLQACDALDGVADGVIDNVPATGSRSLSFWGRLRYRTYRHPLVTFGIGPPFSGKPRGGYSLSIRI